MINSKMVVILFSLAISLAILWPIRQNFLRKPQDNFPLSYYPMFSYKRGGDYTLNYMVGYDSSNIRYYIPYQYYGNGGFNQARRQLNKEVKRNNTDGILKKTLNRIKKKDRQLYARLIRVELARGTFEFDTYFIHRDQMPKQEKVINLIYK